MTKDRKIAIKNIASTSDHNHTSCRRGTKTSGWMTTASSRRMTAKLTKSSENDPSTVSRLPYPSTRGGAFGRRRGHVGAADRDPRDDSQSRAERLAAGVRVSTTGRRRESFLQVQAHAQLWVAGTRPSFPSAQSSSIRSISVRETSCANRYAALASATKYSSDLFESAVLTSACRTCTFTSATPRSLCVLLHRRQRVRVNVCGAVSLH